MLKDVVSLVFKYVLADLIVILTDHQVVISEIVLIFKCNLLGFFLKKGKKIKDSFFVLLNFLTEQAVSEKVILMLKPSFVPVNFSDCLSCLTCFEET